MDTIKNALKEIMEDKVQKQIYGKMMNLIDDAVEPWLQGVLELAEISNIQLFGIIKIWNIIQEYGIKNTMEILRKGGNLKMTKVFDLQQSKDFIEQALDMPPVEEMDEGLIDADKWFEDHKIRISTGDHQIVLDYNADTVMGLTDYLKEQYENECYAYKEPKKSKPKVKVYKTSRKRMIK